MQSDIPLRPLATAGRGPGRSWDSARRRVYLALLVPAVVTLTAVTVFPFLYLLFTSLTPYQLTKPQSLTLTGLENFQQLLGDNRFLNSLWVQLRLSVATVSLQLLSGLAIAMLLNARWRFIELIRTIYIIPMVLPPVVVAIVWKVLFMPSISPINWASSLVGGPQPSWLTDPGLALWALVIADTWEWFPFTMLMLLAALQMMPEEPLEAARIDGASGWQVFRHIILPLLRPTIVVAVLFRLIDSVKAFPHIFIMTQGGPGIVTEATNYYAYMQGFSYTFVGYASAITLAMLIAVFLLSFAIMKLVNTEVDVE
jgi:multiple sugar transport system permease protein